MGDSTPVSYKRGERDKYEKMLDIIVNRWNGESNDNREKYHRTDAWTILMLN
ncbi:hypothetical protein LCGC14_0810620 [marine sediment metagenome]|uniref:Uncharacterized protein n=1 Tax=marine sediment metagenome TaxID=412755 RepID=A0A0F9PRB0_9ZZZZ|nr:MAG: hypothetical protein Lokiarch_11260 [Candidatus Lokiarchaeum sp. GC14_75]